jgi:hypothetical protein
MGLLSVVALAELLRCNRRVTSISVRGNHLNTESAALFAEGYVKMIFEKTKIHKCQIKFTVKLCLLASKVLLTLSSLLFFFSSSFLLFFFSYSSQFSSLVVKNGMECVTCLDLSYNLITLNNLQHAATFFRALALMDTLRILKLNSNEMRDDAMWGVASFLASNPSLKCLELCDQDFKRRKTLQNLFQNLRFNNKLVTLDLRYNPSVLNEYLFQAESYEMVAKELEVKNPGLRVLPFHEDPNEIVMQSRRRIPNRKDLYPTLKSMFSYDDMHRTERYRVERSEAKMREKGSMHVRYHKEGTLVV